MKQLALIISLFFSFCAVAQIDKVIPKKPTPQRLVNDFAGILTPEQRETLENKLVAYDDSTSNQIAIVTIKTTDGNDIEEVALGILRTWGVGGSKNNGIVILAATDDHKIFISTGYGLEGAVPDITTKTIVDNDVTPNFKEGNFYRGFDQATTSIIKAAAGEYKAPEGYRNNIKGTGGGLGKLVFGIIILIIILSMFGKGGGGGGYVSRRGSGWLGPMILGNLLGRGTGGGFGGGDFGGGGGGGFGGFGGGSGGGGGAGGSW